MQLLVLAAVTACDQGEIRWDGGQDALRTAWYRRIADAERERVTIVLSNGLFDCDFPSFESPQDQAEALGGLTTSACRENARHLTLTLYADPVTEGLYSLPIGSEVPTLGELGADAQYTGIDEAQALSFQGLIPTYQPTAWTTYSSDFDPGYVQVTTLDDRLHARFEIPEVDLSGHFVARECPDVSPLFELLAAAPIASCAFGTP